MCLGSLSKHSDRRIRGKLCATSGRVGEEVCVCVCVCVCARVCVCVCAVGVGRVILSSRIPIHLSVYLSLHTAAPSFEYYVQLRCQCKIKGYFIGDKKV